MGTMELFTTPLYFCKIAIMKDEVCVDNRIHML